MALQAASGIAVLGLIIVVILASFIWLSCRDNKQISSNNNPLPVSNNRAAMETQPEQQEEKEEVPGPKISVGKSVKYSSYITQETKSDGNSSCAICLEEFKDEDACRVLTCKHKFHESCVDEWLTKNRFNCPLCRAAVHLDLEAPKPTTDNHQHGALDVLDWISGVLQP